jgi:hypothetical protein
MERSWGKKEKDKHRQKKKTCSSQLVGKVSFEKTSPTRTFLALGFYTLVTSKKSLDQRNSTFFFPNYSGKMDKSPGSLGSH